MTETLFLTTRWYNKKGPVQSGPLPVIPIKSSVEMHQIFLTFDSLMIQLYRLTGYTLVDFFLGTFVLALAAKIIGELTSSMAFLAVRQYIEKSTDEMVRFQNLSVDALTVGDGATYTACNKLANDAFGKTFFMQVSLSAALLWPVPFVLAWMQSRFSDVEFELLFTDYSVGYLCIFITLYAAAYLIFKRIKYRVPYFREMAEIMAGYRKRAREMKSLADLLPPRRV